MDQGGFPPRSRQNKRPCPMNKSCGGFRKPGEIFCHSCYFKLPKELRDKLWARNFRALQPTIQQCEKYLKLLQEGK